MNTERKIKIPHISARTPNQKAYIKAVLENDIILVTGPPGVGKSCIPIGLAICALFREEITKIVYSRPMVSCGKELGALPGTAEEKIDPYLIPFFDEAHKLLNRQDFEKYRRYGQIETCPISLMRGRTVDGWLIISEAQNLTKKELKTILTRIGENGKIILEGDLNQSDLPKSDYIKVADTVNSRYDKYELPFKVCIDKLYDINKLAIVTLDKTDIQRNKIVGDIEDRLWDW